MMFYDLLHEKVGFCCMPIFTLFYKDFARVLQGNVYLGLYDAFAIKKPQVAKTNSTTLSFSIDSAVNDVFTCFTAGLGMADLLHFLNTICEKLKLELQSTSQFSKRRVKDLTTSR